MVNWQGVIHSGRSRGIAIRTTRFLLDTAREFPIAVASWQEPDSALVFRKTRPSFMLTDR